MTVYEVISMLQKLKRYIMFTPIDKCSYCNGCSQTSVNKECVECIKASTRALDFVIEKVKEKM